MQTAPTAHCVAIACILERLSWVACTALDDEHLAKVGDEASSPTVTSAAEAGMPAKDFEDFGAADFPLFLIEANAPDAAADGSTA